MAVILGEIVEVFKGWDRVLEALRIAIVNMRCNVVVGQSQYMALLVGAVDICSQCLCAV